MGQAEEKADTPKNRKMWETPVPVCEPRTQADALIIHICFLFIYKQWKWTLVKKNKEKEKRKREDIGRILGGSKNQEGLTDLAN